MFVLSLLLWNKNETKAEQKNERSLLFLSFLIISFSICFVFNASDFDLCVVSVTEVMTYFCNSK